MKDHLNVTTNPLSQPGQGVDDRLHRETGKIQQEPLGEALSESDGVHREDSFDGRFIGIDTGKWDDSAIDDMDLKGALELSASIRKHSASPEGRRLMGMAHHTITPHQVAQLLSGR